MTDKHLSRWFRYRLRTLMGLMTLAAIGLGYYKAYVEPFQMQRQAAEKLAAVGALIGYQPAAPALLRYWLGDDRFMKVVMVKLEHKRFKDEELAPLAELPSLERLYLAATPVTDEGLQHLATLQRLKRLSLWHTKITDDGLAHLAGLNELQVLDIQRTKLTEAGLEHLRGHPNLVQLVHSITFTDAGIDTLASMPRLQLDSLACRTVGDHSLRTIADRFALRDLDVDSIYVTDDGVLHLRKISTLERLQLKGGKATDVGVEQLATLPALDSLSLHRMPVRGECLRPLYDNPSLMHLELSQTEIPFEAVARNFGASARRLWITDRGVRQMDQSASNIASCPRARSVIWNGPIEPDDVRHLDHYPQLESLHLDRRPLRIALAGGLTRMPALHSLSLSVTVDDDGAEILGQLGQLRHLALSARQAMSPQGYRQLSQLTELVGLELRSCGLTDEQLAFVAELKKLETLQIPGNPITSAGIEHLANLPQLHTLNVSFCPQIDDEAFAKISRLERLANLSAQQTQVTDAGLTHLFDMPHLRDVTVLGSKTTRPGLQRLRSVLITKGGSIY